MDDGALYSSADLQNIEKTSATGVTYALKIPINREIRLKHGLFLSLDLPNRALLLKTKNLEDMAKSTDTQVKLFYKTHKEKLENLAESNGAPFGTYTPLILNYRTPMPCMGELECQKKTS